MLTCIDVKFIFDRVCLGLSSPANILQVADVAPLPPPPPLELSSCCFLQCILLLFRLLPSVVLTLETSEMSVIFFNNQNNSTSSPGLLGKDALTCSGLHL